MLKQSVTWQLVARDIKGNITPGRNLALGLSKPDTLLFTLLRGKAVRGG
jgi:hypothetical protein